MTTLPKRTSVPDENNGRLRTPKSSINLKQVAAYARVSTATVSRVLNNRGYLSDAIKERVLNAVREVGYAHPPRDLIGLILPDSRNPFFTELGAACAFAFEQKYHVLIAHSEEKPDRELALLERFRGLGVRGLVYVPSANSSEAVLSLIAKGDPPTVIVDRRVRAGKVDFVAVNNGAGTLMAVDYLCNFGHERIGYLKGLQGTETARERFEAFESALSRNRLPLEASLIFTGDYSIESGMVCAEKLMDLAPSNRPTALLVANDYMAIGLMTRLQHAGWKLPEMLSVVGFDGMQWGKWTFPALTSVVQPLTQIAHLAFQLLDQRIEKNSSAEPRFVEVEPQLTPQVGAWVQGSVCRPPDTRYGNLRVVTDVTPHAWLKED